MNNIEIYDQVNIINETLRQNKRIYKEFFSDEHVMELVDNNDIVGLYFEWPKKTAKIGGLLTVFLLASNIDFLQAAVTIMNSSNVGPFIVFSPALYIKEITLPQNFTFNKVTDADFFIDEFVISDNRSTPLTINFDMSLKDAEIQLKNNSYYKNDIKLNDPADLHNYFYGDNIIYNFLK